MIKYIPKYMICITLIVVCFLSVFAVKMKRNTDTNALVFVNENINLQKSLNTEVLGQLNNGIYSTTDYNICSSSNKKTYMSYTAITNKNSTQYKFINNFMHVDETTGLLKYNEDSEFIGVALGSYFGPIGSMYEFTLSTGKTIKAIKVEAKSDNHTIDGCYQKYDNSVIEFVIDVDKAKSYYSKLNGNFNNTTDFNGEIVAIKKYEKR